MMDEKRTWAGTFGVGRGLANYYVRLDDCTGEEAQHKMIEMFGTVWCGIYPIEHWDAEKYGTKCLNDFIELNMP